MHRHHNFGLDSLMSLLNDYVKLLNMTTNVACIAGGFVVCFPFVVMVHKVRGEAARKIDKGLTKKRWERDRVEKGKENVFLLPP